MFWVLVKLKYAFGTFSKNGLIEKYPEDIGLVVHETVHVVQLYPKFEPGWVTEGIADYIRWHLYEKKLLEWFPIGEDEKGYEAAYRITGGFFLWITIHKNADFIKINSFKKRQIKHAVKWIFK